MAYVQSDDSLRSDPRTKRAARLLDVSIPEVIGHLHLLWWWGLQFASDGNLSGFDYEEIAEAAMWEGEADDFVISLYGCGLPGKPGFLKYIENAESEQSELYFEDWQELVGNLLEFRRKNRERQAAFRDRQARKKTARSPKSANGAREAASNALHNGYEGASEGVKVDNAHGNVTGNSDVTVMSQEVSPLRNRVNVTNRNVKKSNVEKQSEGEFNDSLPPARIDKPMIDKSTTVPTKWNISAHLYSEAQGLGWGESRQDLQIVADNFVDHHRAKGTRSLDWGAEWRKWLRRELRDYVKTSAAAGSTSTIATTRVRPVRGGGASGIPANGAPLDPAKYAPDGKYGFLFHPQGTPEGKG